MGKFHLPYDLAFLSDFCKSNSQDNREENQTKNIWAICPFSFKLPGEGIVGITILTQCVIVGRTNVIDAIRFDESSSLFRVGNGVRKNQWNQLIILRSLFYVEMFFLNSTLNFGILPVLVFQLEVYYKVDTLLTGLTAQQKGRTCSMVFI